MIKIFHEAPLCIFNKVQGVTDGDYALVHLLDKDTKYAAKFMDVRTTQRERPLILDNSAFDLGVAFDPNILAMWVRLLQPDIYVVPDTIGEAQETVDSFASWVGMFTDLKSKKMGVLQGKSYQEAINCFKALKSLGADIIGIPFLIGKGFGAETPETLLYERAELVRLIHLECDQHPIHLLGVALPQEGYHVAHFPWVESIDSSNPIVHGLFNIRYTESGLDEKRSELLADMIHREVTQEQEDVIFPNIQDFKRMWSRV